MQPTRAQVVPNSPPSIKTTLSVCALAARQAFMPAEPAPMMATSTLRVFIAQLLVCRCRDPSPSSDQALSVWSWVRL
jgi:hypothetical protein